MRRWIGIVIGLIVVGGGGYFAWRTFAAGTTTTTATQQTATIARGDLTVAVSASGAVAAPRSSALSWQIKGTVGQVKVKSGDHVQAGAVLMALDPQSLDPSQLQAQADLLAAQENLATLQAGPTALQLQQAQLAVIQAEQAITTAQRSLDSLLNPVSQALLDSVRNSKAALTNAQTSYQLTNIDPNIAALNNQIFVTNWYKARLDQILAAAKGNEDNQDVKDQIQRAQIDYQAQLDKQYALQLQVDTNRADKNNSLITAQATYSQAVANLQAAQRGPDQAKVTLANQQLAVAKASLLQAQTDLAKLKAGADPKDIAAAKAKIASTQATLDKTRLVAPFDGVVVALYSRAGDVVDTGAAAVTIADLSALQIQVDVAEVDINRIAVGQEVNVTADAAAGLTFTGQVAQVVGLGKSSQGVVTFPVLITIPKPDKALKPGMTGAVSIVTDQRANVLLVPNRALRTSNGQRTVTVMFEGQQFSVPVTLGLTGDTYSEVTGGQLKEGDAVVISTASTTRTSTTTGNNRTGLGGGGTFFIGGGGPPGP